MALFPLNPGIQPLGQMDCVDTEISSLLGGEVMTLTSVAAANSASEKHAADADGYLYDASGTLLNRAAAVRASAATSVPLYLCDDGTTGYGTFFGQVIGVPTGLSTTGTNLGPHTASGSGKVTLWDKPGRYAITTDALAADFISSIPSTGLFPGEVLGFGSGADLGKVAHDACANKVAGSGIGYLVELKPRPGLVNTPARLVQVGAPNLVDRVELEFHAGAGNRTLN